MLMQIWLYVRMDRRCYYVTIHEYCSSVSLLLPCLVWEKSSGFDEQRAAPSGFMIEDRRLFWANSALVQANIR